MLKQKQRNKVRSTIALLAIFVLVFSSGCADKGGTQAAKDAYKNVKLSIWSVWDDETAMSGIMKAYQAEHPNVSFDYKKFRYEEYEPILLTALAEGRGPDIFSIHNTWMERHKEKIEPFPDKVTIPVKSFTGTIKKEEVIELIPKKIITELEVKKKFLDVVYNDVVMNTDVGTGLTNKTVKKVYGLPLSLDTLVMFYNKDLMKNSGIPEPPTTWTDFQKHVKLITKVDPKTSEILISGASIGTADNVPRAFDILSVLMMQSMAVMTDSYGQPAFNQRASDASIEGIPGITALSFYTQFSNPLFDSYSWNNAMPDATEAFMKGRVGYFFGYSYNRDQFRAQAPKLSFGIAPIPQLNDQQKSNYANYWVSVVSKSSKNKNYAFDFLQYMVDEKNVEKFLDAAERNTALRSSALISKELQTEDLSAGADQLLTAKSWYRGANVAGAEQAFKDLINTVMRNEMPPVKALEQAIEQVSFSMRPQF